MRAMFSGLLYCLQRACRYGPVLGLALMAGLSQAEIVDRLYEVSIPVQDQSEKERRLALMTALDQVLVRASGQNLVTLQANGVLQSKRSKAEDYLQEYRYGTVKKDGTAAASTIELTARFAPETIRQLLAEAALPLWPRNRPTVMVWWQVEEKGQVRLLGEELRTEAGRRGLPLVLPMNDLQDKLAQEALWRFDPEAITRLADRYGISALLVGRSTGNALAGWQGQWLFYFRGEFIAIPAATEAGLPAPWLEGDTLEDLGVGGVDAVVGILLQRYGIDLAGSTHQVELVVSGVNSFADYSQTLRYVQNLEAIRSATLVKADQQTLHYQLVFDGHLAVLRELLGLGVMLTEDNPEAAASLPDSEAPTVLYYHFRRQP